MNVPVDKTVPLYPTAVSVGMGRTPRGAATVAVTITDSALGEFAIHLDAKSAAVLAAAVKVTLNEQARLLGEALAEMGDESE